MEYLMIADYKLRQVFDSKGNPTVEAEIYLEDGTKAKASVPNGSFKKNYEAFEKKDNNMARFQGKGLESTLKYATGLLSNEIIGINAFNQRGLDQLLISLDNTENKSNIGANVMLAISLASAKAAAAALKLPFYRYLGGVNAHWLPVPFMTMISGSVQGDRMLDIKEFMIIPVGTSSFYEGFRWGTEIYHHLKEVLKSKGLSTNTGDEGGFAPDVQNSKEALDLITLAVENAGYRPGRDIVYALDVGATSRYHDDIYVLENFELNSFELIEFYEDLCNQYPIVSIQDGFQQDDWESWVKLTAELKHKVQIVGGDLFATNSQRLQHGIHLKAATALLIKPVQIGTLTETIDTIHLAHTKGISTIISDRSGETEDTSIADLAVALNTRQIKVGPPCRTERIAKYNRLLYIEQELGSSSTYSKLFI